MIKNEIEKYLKNYNQKKLVKIELEPGRTSLSDIIFIKNQMNAISFHMLTVNEQTFNVHLKYMFAGTGKKD